MHSFEFQEHTEWFLPKTQNLKKKRPQYLKRFLENGNFVSLTHAHSNRINHNAKRERSVQEKGWGQILIFSFNDMLISLPY